MIGAFVCNADFAGMAGILERIRLLFPEVGFFCAALFRFQIVR